MKPGRQKEGIEGGRERYTEEEGVKEGLGGISVLNISSNQAGNNADLEQIGQSWESLWCTEPVSWKHVISFLFFLNFHWHLPLYLFRFSVCIALKLFDILCFHQIVSQLPNNALQRQRVLLTIYNVGTAFSLSQLRRCCGSISI